MTRQQHTRVGAAEAPGSPARVPFVFWDNLSTTARTAITRAGISSSYRRDQIVCREIGCDDVHLVTRGYVRASHSARANEAAVLLGLLAPGDLVNALAAVRGLPHATWLEAATAVTVHTLAPDRFAELCQTHPTTGWACAVAVAHQAGVRQRPRTASGVGTATRLCAALVDAAFELDERPGDGVVITAGQRDLAHSVAASRESFCRLLRDLRQAGLVTTCRGRITIHDVAGLAMLARLNHDSANAPPVHDGLSMSSRSAVHI